MKKLLLVLVSLGLIAAGATYYDSSNRNGAENGFSYESVKYGSLSDVVNATGIVKPREIAVVFCRVPGIVEEIFPSAKVGHRVEKDQPLFKVSSEFAKRGLERAQAQVKKAKGLRDSAKDAVDHLKNIADKGYPQPKEKELEAQTKYTAAVEGVDEAESGLKQAELAMEWTTVKAPIAGVIIEKNLYLGQPVGLSAAAGGGGSAGGSNMAAPSPTGLSSSGPSTTSFFGMTEPKIPFIIAADLGDLEIYAQIPQGDIGRVKAGLPVKFTVDAFPDEPEFTGKITEVLLMPMNVLGSNFYPAVIKVANRRVGQADPNARKAKEGDADWILRPGMTVNVDITRETHNDVWMLPSAALSFTLDDAYISPAARDELKKLSTFKNPNDWKTVWIMGDDKKPWPIFARIGGTNKEGKPGISANSGGAEVLEWDPKTASKLDPKNPATYPQLINAAPQPKQSIFDRPTLKFS
jgi:HlyD family secretion protein